MNTSILIVSCDAYADAWDSFFKNFYQYWPDCPYPVYLQTNYLVPQYSNTQALPIGEDRDWSSNLISAIKKMTASKVLILLEDFWLWQPVDTSRILMLDNYMDSLRAGYLRLVPKPPPDEMLSPAVGRIHKGSFYRVSFQAGLWQCDVLQKILKPGESAWEAEMAGSVRSNHNESEFLSVGCMPDSQWPIRYLNAIIKRKWTPEAIKLAKQRNIIIDLNRREVCNSYDQFRRKKIFRETVYQIALLSRKMLGNSLYQKIKKIPFIQKIIY